MNTKGKGFERPKLPCTDAGPNSQRSPRFNPFARLFFGETPLLVSAVLRECPQAWVGDWMGGELYHITHAESGTRVWVANSAYGIAVRSPGFTWGAVTMLSSFGLSPGHWLIWAAGRRWAKVHARAAPPRGPAGLKAALMAARASGLASPHGDSGREENLKINEAYPR